MYSIGWNPPTESLLLRQLPGALPRSFFISPIRSGLPSDALQRLAINTTGARSRKFKATLGGISMSRPQFSYALESRRDANT
jgi:hypothetical protein